ncbi:GNAT family N-acetyltransferase [Paenibacillus sp. 1001270B_150601_E10]|uniref:GNAT family N-acetyltransferase n=1 Tax=Paenibacillus sp. 1001270B_150601_E10 TaxID=2787079 RepID=UPI00189D495D|nr:N-acetyltransferase [Paenibacillus sp. 1001270B_150601_E10]
MNAGMQAQHTLNVVCLRDLYLLCVNEKGEAAGLHCSILRGIHAKIPTLAVKREWQRRGMGKAMLSEILQRLQQTGAVDVQLSIESKNDAAMQLYRKYGFEEEYQRIHYVSIF